METLRIIVVDDEKGYRDEISEYLIDLYYEVYVFEQPSQALGHVAKNQVDIAILDLRLPQMDGLELMRRLHELSPGISVIMISGHGDMDSVIAALREGAVDFFPKPFDLYQIRCAIERTRNYLELKDRLQAAQTTCDALFEALVKHRGIPLIGDSPQLKQVIHRMGQISGNPHTDVLVIGESGTGKELVAWGIHLLSPGSSKVFFDVNCTAIPDTLFESEFFGHTKNAFTGARDEKKGAFEIANGGTLYLDEIGDLPLNMQAKLLRVLEERKVRRIGSNTDIPLLLRVIASTNKDLKDLISRKLFREDLFYRLNRFPIQIPPLRDRPQDIPLLLNFYLRHLCQMLKKPLKPISARSLEHLLIYSYPGNVRELRNMLEQAIILSPDTAKELMVLCDPLQPTPEHKIFPLSDDLNLNRLEQLEKDMILSALQKCCYNKSKAAEMLHITRTCLQRRLHKYKLDS